MHPLQKIKCHHCRQEFKPRLTRHSTYCSRGCSFSSKSAAPFSDIWITACIGCSRMFTAKRNRKYCSPKCHPRAKWVSVMPTTKECAACGAHYNPISTGGAPSSYCSEGCRAAVAASRKRIERAKRKALLAETTVESVDPYVVFTRDRWRCQLCRVKTPRSKRGSYDDDAPELDHIIPLARGGQHSYLNTQCSCRKCNCLKSDHALGQLLLIG